MTICTEYLKFISMYHQHPSAFEESYIPYDEELLGESRDELAIRLENIHAVVKTICDHDKPVWIERNAKR